MVWTMRRAAAADSEIIDSRRKYRRVEFAFLLTARGQEWPQVSPSEHLIGSTHTTPTPSTPSIATLIF